MNCAECGLEKLEGHVHYCLEALKAEVARLHTVCSNQFEKYRKGTEEWAKTADEERDRADAYQAAYNLLKGDVESHLFRANLGTELLQKRLNEAKARVDKSTDLKGTNT